MAETREQVFCNVVREELSALVNNMNAQILASKNPKIIGMWYATRPLILVQIKQITPHDAIQLFDKTQSFVEKVKNAFNGNRDTEIQRSGDEALPMLHPLETHANNVGPVGP